MSFKDSLLDKDNCYNIVMEYCEGGDLYSKVRNAKGKNFPEEVKFFKKTKAPFIGNSRVICPNLPSSQIFA